MREKKQKITYEREKKNIMNNDVEKTTFLFYV